MSEEIQKRSARSPNYPQNSLEWAIRNGLALMEKEGFHPIPPDIIAAHLKYKDANNGAAKRAIASLRAFGLIQKAAGGKLQVNREAQRYKLAPSESDKTIYLQQWLRKPLLYTKLLEKYKEKLPSDAALVYELVDEHGFNESAARNAIAVFRQSLEYVEKHAGVGATKTPAEDDSTDEDDEFDDEQDGDQSKRGGGAGTNTPPRAGTPPPAPDLTGKGVRYPVRLAGGRMAWIEIPEPFFEADKSRLQAQLAIIGTVDEDEAFREQEM